jgi:thiol-disulfide isomerase/thioredoxin
MAKEETTVEVIEEPTNVEETEEELSPWYYFFSQGCGWCKKSSPIVEELIKEGHDILLLDLAEPDNQKLSNELKQEYGAQCGTPWFINADTGKQICGFREKDILEKWLAGEDIPAPPRPSSPPPKVPFQGSTNKQEIAWKKEYKKWLEDNEHMPEAWQKQQKSASELIDAPRPKSDPPLMPNIQQVNDKQIDEWGENYKKWAEENKHLPNLQPVETLVQNIKNRKAQMTGQAPAAPAVDNTKLNSLDAKVQSLEVKINKIMDHFGVK